MLSPHVSMLLDDPALGGGQPFEIHRRTVNRVTGADDTEPIKATGNIQPASPDDMARLPEADRPQRVKVFRSKALMQTGHDDGESYTHKDVLHYEGKEYNVLQVDPWEAWGMSFAYATERV